MGSGMIFQQVGPLQPRARFDGSAGAHCGLVDRTNAGGSGGPRAARLLHGHEVVASQPSPCSQPVLPVARVDTSAQSRGKCQVVAAEPLLEPLGCAQAVRHLISLLP